MRLFNISNQILGGSLLIAGTTIGVGMLALPVATGPSGFFPSILTYLACWLFMLSTGLLLLEVCLWMPKEANLITMASKMFGRWGQIICWIVYLFLFLSVMVAHVLGGGQIFQEFSSQGLSFNASTVLYVLLFSPVIYLGTRFVDRLNSLLMAGVITSYLLFLFISFQHIDLSLITYTKWSKAWCALPVLFTSFTYQVIIPTLVTYMKRDVKQIRKAIILGTSIPLVVYIVWEFVILGIVPVEGANGLLEAQSKGDNAVAPLKHFVQSPYLVNIGKSFAFFTMTTSYIGLALAYVDFLADGLKVKKTNLNKFFLCLTVFIPPTLIGMTYPHLFMQALHYAGGFACSLLFGFLPPLMVWVGRYKLRYTTKWQQIKGGKALLTALMLFIAIEIVIEIVKLF
ncbi:MAG: amino acid permease [Rhabdochlamydiaceae bacterium]